MEAHARTNVPRTTATGRYLPAPVTPSTQLPIWKNYTVWHERLKVKGDTNGRAFNTTRTADLFTTMMNTQVTA